MEMALLDVLNLIDKDYFPVTVCKDGVIDTRPQSGFEVTICFMSEKETWLTCNIQNEILIPWYDCKVSSIQPNIYNNNSICIWLHDREYIKKNYPQHLCEEGKRVSNK